MFHKGTQLHTKEMWENTKSVLYFHQISNMTQLILFKVIFIRRFHGVFSILSKLSVDFDFSIPANIRLDEDVLKTSFVFVFKSRLQDVLMETNIFLLIIRLQKTCSRRLGQDQYIRLVHTSWKRLEDVFKTSSRPLAKTTSRCIQDVFKTSSRRLAKTSLKRLQDVLQIHLEDIFTTFWRCLQNILKTSF